MPGSASDFAQQEPEGQCPSWQELARINMVATGQQLLHHWALLYHHCCVLNSKDNICSLWSFGINKNTKTPKHQILSVSSSKWGEQKHRRCKCSTWIHRLHVLCAQHPERTRLWLMFGILPVYFLSFLEHLKENICQISKNYPASPSTRKQKIEN